MYVDHTFLIGEILILLNPPVHSALVASVNSLLTVVFDRTELYRLSTDIFRQKHPDPNPLTIP